MRLNVLLIIVFLVCATSVTSEGASIAWAPNKAGGKIVLEDTVCYSRSQQKSYPGLFNMHAYDRNGTARRGCWRPEEDTAHIAWEGDGDESYIPFARFQLKQLPEPFPNDLL